MSFGDVRDEVKRVALAVACDMVLIVGRWETLSTEVEYTHGLVCAVEYGDGFIVDRVLMEWRVVVEGLNGIG